MSFFVERELIANLGVRAGYVKKIGKNNWQEVQVGRSYTGYSDARTFADQVLTASPATRMTARRLSLTTTRRAPRFRPAAPIFAISP